MADRVLSWVFEGRDRISPAAASASRSVSGLAGAVDKAKDAELRSRAATIGSERAALAVADARRRAAVVTKNASSTEEQRRRAVLSVESAEVRHAQSLRKVDSANRALIASTKAVSGSTEAAAAKSGVLGGALRTAVAGGAVFAGAAVLKFGRDALSAASDTSESVSKAGVVFGRSAAAVVAFGDTSARSVGIAKQEAVEAAATFGNLFTALKIGQRPAADMSVRMVTLASDLASFNNANPADVLTDLRAGLLGEAEPLRKFGVALNEAAVAQEAMRETGKKAAAQLTEGEKVAARYQLILRSTTTAQGDFARTSGGLANQQRIAAAEARDLAAAVGKILLPAVTTGTHALVQAAGPLESLAEGIAGLPPGVKAAAADFALMFGAVKLGQKAFGGLASSIAAAPLKHLSVSLEGTVSPTTKARAAVTGLGRGIAGAVGAIGPWNLALVGGAAVLGYWAQRTADARKAQDDLTAAIVADGNALGIKTRAEVNARLESAGALRTAKDLGVSYESLTGAALGNADAYAAVRTALRSYLDEQTRYVPAGKAAVAVASEQHVAAVKLLAVLDEQGGKTRRSAEQADRLSAAGKGATTATNQFGEAVDKTTGKVVAEKSAVDKLRFSLDILSGKNVSAAEADIAFRESLASLTSTVHDNAAALKKQHGALNLSTVAGRAAEKAFLDGVTAAQSYAQAVTDQTGSVEQGQAAYRKSITSLIATARQSGLTRAQVDALTAAFGRVPPVKTTLVNARTGVAMANLATLLRRVRELPANRTVTLRAVDQASSQIRSIQRRVDALTGKTYAIRIVTTGGAILGDPSVRLGGSGHAAGTPSAPPGWAWAGERGPELIRFRGGERVLSHPDSVRAASSQPRVFGPTLPGPVPAAATVNNYFTINGATDPRAVADAVARAIVAQQQQARKGARA